MQPKPDAIAVRHFATPLNDHGISRGHLPIGIDKDEAKKLAPGVARTLERYGVTRLISSDLPRGEQSAKMIAGEMEPKPKVESLPELSTWDTGSMAGKKESVTIPKRQAYIKNSDLSVPGGESFDDFIDRFRGERENILKPHTAAILHGHHLLAARAVLADKEVNPDKLATLDEDFPPGSVWGFFIDGDKVRAERLDEKQGDDE